MAYASLLAQEWTFQQLVDLILFPASEIPVIPAKDFLISPMEPDSVTEEDLTRHGERACLFSCDSAC